MTFAPVSAATSRRRGCAAARWRAASCTRRPRSITPIRSASDGGVLERVRDQQRGELEAGEEVTELVANLLAGDRVERAERLVEQQHSWLARERAGERHALALAA